MWDKNWRNQVWSQLEHPWDVLVVGGGITGAGILREAARLKLRTLLIEQRDFAWGTSSRSSKLVHGGLRYLAQGQLRLTWASVRERESLLQCGPGLIQPLGFLVATHKGDKPGRLAYQAGLSLYDLMAQQWTHQEFSPDEFRMLAPGITSERLEGGFRYQDAQTDDARLVIRVIREAVADGAVAINYVTAEALLRTDDEVTGVQVCDRISGRRASVRARLVVNATGAWADGLRGQMGARARIRPLRGSHLVFAGWRLPLAQAIAFAHPLDHRPVFAYPWEGATLVGTTDIDHSSSLDDEPGISPPEVTYLMAAVTHQFPTRGLSLDDVISTYAGVRPVIGTGKDDPSKESRDYVVWQENGLLTVTGGKLTTFRLIALDALRTARDRLPDMPPINDRAAVLNAVADELPSELDEALRKRLIGRYGADASALIAGAQTSELEPVANTPTLWAELRWAARAEGVAHLDDLLLRRTRLGLLVSEGGAALLERIRAICQMELGWDDARWEAEEASYRALWRTAYSLPDRAAIADWTAMLQSARARGAVRPRQTRHLWIAAVGLTVLLLVLFWRRRTTPQRAIFDRMA